MFQLIKLSLLSEFYWKIHFSHKPTNHTLLQIILHYLKNQSIFNSLISTDFIYFKVLLMRKLSFAYKSEIRAMSVILTLWHSTIMFAMVLSIMMQFLNNYLFYKSKAPTSCDDIGAFIFFIKFWYRILLSWQANLFSAYPDQVIAENRMQDNRYPLLLQGR